MGWSQGVGGVAEVEKNITPLYEQPNTEGLLAHSLLTLIISLNPTVFSTSGDSIASIIDDIEYPASISNENLVKHFKSNIKAKLTLVVFPFIPFFHECVEVSRLSFYSCV